MQQNFILQSNNLLEKPLKFAEEYNDIPANNKAIMKHAWKSLLFNKSETWMKMIVDCLTSQLVLLMEQKHANLPAISYSICYLKNRKERILLYTVMMD